MFILAFVGVVLYKLQLGKDQKISVIQISYLLVLSVAESCVKIPTIIMGLSVSPFSYFCISCSLNLFYWAQVQVWFLCLFAKFLFIIIQCLSLIMFLLLASIICDVYVITLVFWGCLPTMSFTAIYCQHVHIFISEVHLCGETIFGIVLWFALTFFIEKSIFINFFSISM